MPRRIKRYVRRLMDGRSALGRQDTHTLCKWIRFCRHVEWYFEGRTLYERAGFQLDALSEAERVAVEEDYVVCKRELNRYRNSPSNQLHQG